MSINACSINAFTIDAARCRRPNLFRPAPDTTIIGTNNRNVSIDFAKNYPHLVRHSEREVEDHPPLQFEQPFISVSAELFGQTSLQTLEARPHLEFVTATDLEIGEATPGIAVNITDISI